MVISKRWLPWVTGTVVALFLVIAVPGSPVATWLSDFLVGSHGEIAGVHVQAVPVPGGAAARPALRAAVAAMISPQQTYLRYREIFETVAQRLGRPLIFVQRKTYGEINELLEAGDIDLAWVCTGALEDLNVHGGVRMVAMPLVSGRPQYRAYVIVREPGRIRSLQDLRGRRFAFTDPLSLTGRKVIVRWLGERGTNPEAFFSNTFFTHAHDNSILAVRRGLADGATVDSLVYDWLRRAVPEKVKGTRVIWRSEWFPIPPLVVPNGLDPGYRRRIQKALLGLGSDPATRKILDEIGVDRFAAADPDLYSR